MALAFPYSIDRTGRSAQVEGDDDLVALIEQVLFTAPGERPNRPDFGAGLHHLVFSPGGDQVATAVQHLAQASLQQWLADLITVDRVEVRASEGVLEITVSWRARRDGQARTVTLSREA